MHVLLTNGNNAVSAPIINVPFIVDESKQQPTVGGRPTLAVNNFFEPFSSNANFTNDLHIWTITSGLDALSAHVVVPVGEDRDAVLDRLQQLLRDRCGIDHATLQIVEEQSERVQLE